MKHTPILARALALACLLFAGLGVPALPAFAQPAAASSPPVAVAPATVSAPLYVYKGNGSDGRKAVPQFEAFIGRKVDGVVDFLDQGSWAKMDSDAAWAIPAWKGSGYKLVLSVPLTMWGTSLADIAAGKQDAHFVKVAQLLVANGYGDAGIRLGWEMDLGNYAWAAAPDTAAYKAAYQHEVTVMRAQAGAHFTFIWNPSLGWNQVTLDKIFPGSAYVDQQGYDVYSQSWARGNGKAVPEPDLVNQLLTESWGLNGACKFHPEIPIFLGEYGVGDRSDGNGAPNGGDDPTYVQKTTAWMAGLKAQGCTLAGVNYWDYHAGDFNGLLSDGKRPSAATAFLAAFGRPPTAAPAAPVVAAPKATFSAWASDGATVVLTPTADGGGVLAVTFPKTAGSHHYTIWLSTPRHVETWGRMPQIGWDTAGGTVTVHVGAN